MIKNFSIEIRDTILFKHKVLSWLKQFNTFCFLETVGNNYDAASFDWLIGVGIHKILSYSPSFFEDLNPFQQNATFPLFGHLAYDLKNDIENVKSKLHPAIDFGKATFFEPELLLTLKQGRLEVCTRGLSPETIVDAINKIDAQQINPVPANLEMETETQDDYIARFEAIQNHIQRGDCYEMNYCKHFSVKSAKIDPSLLYKQLTDVNVMPFSAFYKLDNRYCICASPERYIKKVGTRLLSQPMKGTAPRDADNLNNDEILKLGLFNSEKERTENVMIVDLVRNDLSKVAKRGTVVVDELFGVYSFPKVHQMISTIGCELKDGVGLGKILKATFPMGSMTGAPKKRVLELIDDLENFNRGLFSGAIGYVLPNGDFDFNVVIRSFFYDEKKDYLEFFAGGGITALSIAKNEYDECILKSHNMLKILTKNGVL